MSQTRLWILGAADPEMEAIEALLRECGERVAYATSDAAGTIRVTAGNAYRGVTMPAALRSGYRGERTVSPGTTWYLAECDLGGVRPYGDPAVIIDHHRPGDPGFGRPPSEFLPASSIGQVISELARLGRLPARWACGRIELPDVGTYVEEAIDTDDRHYRRWVIGQATPTLGIPACAEIPSALVLAAAADHCLGAAYRGECPGVDPDELMRGREGLSPDSPRPPYASASATSPARSDLRTGG